MTELFPARGVRYSSPAPRVRKVQRGYQTLRGRARAGAGFTLIELMIVVAIIAILTAIAYPAYTSYITKTHRVAAEGCLSEYSNYMERYYTTNLRYDQTSPASGSPVALALPTLDCAGTQRTGINYSYPTSSASISAAAYTIRAVPVPNSAQAKRDTQCGTLSINQAGQRGASGPGGVAKCW